MDVSRTDLAASLREVDTVSVKRTRRSVSVQVVLRPTFVSIGICPYRGLSIRH